MSGRKLAQGFMRKKSKSLAAAMMAQFTKTCPAACNLCKKHAQIEAISAVYDTHGDAVRG
jgi:hypothetical protein